MTPVSAIGRDVVPASQSALTEYEGIVLDTDDPDKLIPFVDQMLFFLRVQGFKTRPVTIHESQGVMEIRWTGRKPKAFRDRLLAVSSFGEHLDCFQVAAA